MEEETYCLLSFNQQLYKRKRKGKGKNADDG